MCACLCGLTSCWVFSKYSFFEIKQSSWSPCSMFRPNYWFFPLNHYDQYLPQTRLISQQASSGTSFSRHVKELAVIRNDSVNGDGAAYWPNQDWGQGWVASHLHPVWRRTSAAATQTIVCLLHCRPFGEEDLDLNSWRLKRIMNLNLVRHTHRLIWMDALII